MTTIALSSLSKSTRSPLFAGIQNTGSQAGKRWLHRSPARQAIMMPAMSPFMTEGTITGWKKREGEAFAVGDILLQIESDIAMIDVEAQNPGVLGKILMPDGTTNVPVEQVIALVVKDAPELANLSGEIPVVPPQYNPVPSPTTSRSIPSPLHLEQFNQPFMMSSGRSPSLFERQTMGHSSRLTTPRGMTMKHARGQNLTIVPPSSQIDVQSPFPTTTMPSSRMHPLHPKTALGIVPAEENLPDGAAIRRMIVSNLSRTPISAVPHGKTDDHFDELF